MPELPEVETLAGDLRRAGVCGQRIIAIRTIWAGCIEGISAQSFQKKIIGKTLASISRRGKYLVFMLKENGALLLHLRMSGRIMLRGNDEKHDRLILFLEDGRKLCFNDPRKFGRWRLSDNPELFLQKLGPEPLDRKLTAHKFHARLQFSRRRIKTLLMDQAFMAGVGNIYADETLWLARIHPERPGNSLTTTESAGLLSALRRVLREALENRGSTLGKGAGHYVGADGRIGGHQKCLQVYQRTGKSCFRCGSRITRQIVNQRGTHFCPRCQKP